MTLKTTVLSNLILQKEVKDMKKGKFMKLEDLEKQAQNFKGIVPPKKEIVRIYNLISEAIQQYCPVNFNTNDFIVDTDQFPGEQAIVKYKGKPCMIFDYDLSNELFDDEINMIVKAFFTGAEFGIEFLRYKL